MLISRISLKVLPSTLLPSFRIMLRIISFLIANTCFATISRSRLCICEISLIRAISCVCRSVFDMLHRHSFIESVYSFSKLSFKAKSSLLLPSYSLFSKTKGSKCFIYSIDIVSMCFFARFIASSKSSLLISFAFSIIESLFCVVVFKLCISIMLTLLFMPLTNKSSLDSKRSFKSSQRLNSSSRRIILMPFRIPFCVSGMLERYKQILARFIAF